MTARSPVTEPPRGMRRLALLGPGFLWMVSAAGSGELLFTPRIAALHGYALLWALVAAVILKWFINREVGRLAVCRGVPVLEAFAALGGPRNWAVWVILVPQVFVAVASIAGLAGSAGTALVLFLPGDVRLWVVASILSAAALVLWGRYRAVERTATVLAAALSVAAVIAATRVAPPASDLAAGLVPRVPEGADPAEILPWLGFMLSGAAGIMWYSYWVRAKGYGFAEGRDAEGPVDPARLDAEDHRRLRGWITQMTLDTTVAVLGTLVVTISFLVLGAELLRPAGLVPDEDHVAEDLGRLLGGVWGRAGFWFMVVGVFVGFWDTVLSDQDGFGRLFASGTRLLARELRLPERWTDERRLQRAFVVVLVTVLPIALYLAMGRPVALLKAAGAVEAAHLPLVAALVLRSNLALPRGLRPRPFSIAGTAAGGLFFAVFAAYYAFDLVQR